MEEELEESKKSPIWYIMAMFLIFLMVISFVPYYAIKEDPKPSHVPSIDEVIPGYSLGNISKKENKQHLGLFVDAADPLTKQVATRIATIGCDDSRTCQVRAQYLFVRDNFIYVGEQDEYVQSPEEFLATRGGDCDDHAVMLANLLQAIGVPTRFVYVPRHVYIEAYLPQAPSKYHKEGWIPLDPTCKSCKFGKTTPDY